MAIASHTAAISVATGASTTYLTLGGMMTVSYDDSRDSLDTTDFMDANIRRRMVGLRDLSLSVNGVCDLTDTGQLLLKAAHRSQTSVYVRVLYDGTNGFMTSFLVGSISTEGAIDDKVSVSCSLETDGATEPVDVA